MNSNNNQYEDNQSSHMTYNAMKLKPSRVDPRDKHFASHRFFFGASLPSSVLLQDLEFPDQNLDGRPTGCTSYAVTQLAKIVQNIEFSHDFQFMKTCQFEGVDGTTGVEIRSALSVPVSVGLLPFSNQPSVLTSLSQNWIANPTNWPNSLDSIAAQHRINNYHPLVPSIGQDYFDAIRMILAKGQGVALGTQWSPDFETITGNGILPDNPRNLSFGHAYLIVGYKTIGSTDYLAAITWQGEGYGDNGFCYLSRTLTNKLLSVWGTMGGTYGSLSSATVEDLKNQKTTTYEVLIAFMKNLIITLQHNLGLI